ncbi:MAG: hypothetical protein OJJ54_21900 [Pseudonocardia sp.]|nr:hypothetical protein [Pseudonocardia sp.]
MRRPCLLRLAPAAVAVLAALAGSAGCAHAIAGTAVAEPPPAAGGTPVRVVGPLLVGDAVRDECLLDAAGLAALLASPTTPPANSTTTRPDGTTTHSCTATATEGDPRAIAAVNVYGVRDGTPADVVRAGAGRREMSEVGDAAAVVDTASGPTMQIASGTYLVTIAVAERRPSDAEWRAAGRAALSRLP